MIRVIGDKIVLEEIYYNYLNNNKISHLEIYIELSPELEYKLPNYEPVFEKNMNNQNILAILTELLYNKDNDFIVSDLSISSNFKELSWVKTDATVSVTLKYKNEDDLFIAERKILLEKTLGIQFQD